MSYHTEHYTNIALAVQAAIHLYKDSLKKINETPSQNQQNYENKH